MKKIIILLLCCGVLMSMVGCGGNSAPPPTESPPTTVSETIITEPPTETTPPVTAVEPTEKEKEPVPTERKNQAAEPTVTATEPTITAKPTEEPKPTVTTKPTEPSAAENTEPKEETSPKAEEPQVEIYQGIQWPEVDPADIERLVIEKVNTYRIAQGDTAATMLPGLTEVARYRANELTTNFEHRGEQHVSTELKYGQYIDLAPYGIRGTYTEAELPDLGDGEAIDTSIPADPNVKNYSYTVVDGDVYYRENSRMVKPELNATATERVKGMVELRDCVQKLIGQQMDGFVSDYNLRQPLTCGCLFLPTCSCYP